MSHDFGQSLESSRVFIVVAIVLLVVSSGLASCFCFVAISMCDSRVHACLFSVHACVQACQRAFSTREPARLSELAVCFFSLFPRTSGYDDRCSRRSSKSVGTMHVLHEESELSWSRTLVESRSIDRSSLTPPESTHRPHSLVAQRNRHSTARAGRRARRPTRPIACSRSHSVGLHPINDGSIVRNAEFLDEKLNSDSCIHVSDVNHRFAGSSACLIGHHQVD